MVARIFLGLIMIIAFLALYPYIAAIWTDNTSGLNNMMAGMTTWDGRPAMSDLETSIWGMFPVVLLVLGVGGIAWLIVKDRG